MLSSKILNLTSENFDGLKSKGSNLHIKIIEVHQDKFLDIMNELALDSGDWLWVLKSDGISWANKLSIIQNIDSSVIINNRSITDISCEILPNDQSIILSYEVLDAMFSVHKSLHKKITVLNFNFETLSDQDVQILIENMGEDYAKIFMRQHKPTFPNNSQNKILFEKLQARNLIIRYEVNEKKNEVKVFAKY